MIKMGLNTLAILAEGLGIRMPWRKIGVAREIQPVISFSDKPAGVDIVEKTSPVGFEDESIRYKGEEIKYKDR